jgi:Family of unknown function (DUF6065)
MNGPHFQANPARQPSFGTEPDSSGSARVQDGPALLPSCRLQAFRITDQGWGEGWLILPLPARRSWMDAQPYAYQCPPLVVANQWGWQILCPTDVRVTWDGSPSPSGLRVEVDKKYDASIKSQFGEGIVTFGPPWLFRTSPGWDLMAKGPSNHWKPNCSALEGVIETWWLPYTFTLNWKVVTPGTVTFAPGEPLAQLVPVAHATFRDSSLVEAPLSSEPKLEAEMNQWVAERGRRSGEKTATHHFYRKAEGIAEHLVKVPVPKLIRLDIEGSKA